MKYKKILALCSCLSLVGSVINPMVAGAYSIETETEYWQEFLTEKCTEISTEAWTETFTEAAAQTELEMAETDLSETSTESTAEAVTEGNLETENQTDSSEETEEESHESITDVGTEADTEQSTEPGTELDTEHNTEMGTEADTEPGTESVTEADTESDTEHTTESGTEADTETEGITESPTEENSEQNTETDTEAVDDETESTEFESEEESETETETEEESEEDTNITTGYGYQYSSNYFWDPSWYISPDFRFTQVDKKCAIVEGEQDLVSVYDSASEEGSIIGKIPYFGLVFILEDGEDWTYIESGEVRGFVQTSALKSGDYTDLMMQSLGEYNFLSGISEVSPYENKAFTHTHTTTKEVVATKQYGIALFSSEIREYPDDTSRAIGQVASGDLMYILEIAENGWYFVESGDVRGFIDPKLLVSGEQADNYVGQQQEHDVELKLAEELVDPLENESLYYTLKSVRVAGSTVGADIVETAMGFVGKLPYVYGGNSLTFGADCSGFVQAIFESYGIVLPRTAEAQGINGNEVASLKEAKVGDIVYYASGPHVGIYIGNGMVVQCAGDSYNTAANPGKGPTISAADYMPITSIRRYLIDTQDTTGENGKRLDLTGYSQEQLELIWAIVAQEDNGSYEGALAVISSAMNRTESFTWGFEGGNALSQLTAAGQYCYSMDDYWKSRLNGNVPGYVKAAVNDCLKKGIRNHNYTCFRSTAGATTGSGAVQIGGNWYFGT